MRKFRNCAVVRQFRRVNGKKKLQMFRNQYDTDVTIWSPQGRLFQVEYAMQAVLQGSACVGIVSDRFVVLAALKRYVHALCCEILLSPPIRGALRVALEGGAARASPCSKARPSCLAPARSLLPRF